MQPTIIISDVHESVAWKDMVAGRGPGDRVVFLGDYFDRRGSGPYAKSAIGNFREICAYARENPDTFVLAGNHDVMYMPFSPQFDPWNSRDRKIQKAVMEEFDIFRMILVDRTGGKPVIMSHAGLTRTFMDMHGLKEPEDVDVLWKEHPDAFEWIERDPRTGASSDMYGDDPWQSPIWVRPRALGDDAVEGYAQVIGHDPVPSVCMAESAHGDRIVFTCDFGKETLRLEG